VEQHVRLDDLVDRLGDDLDIAGADGVTEAPERGLVACSWAVDIWFLLWAM
jgi:hypothetical protein